MSKFSGTLSQIKNIAYNPTRVELRLQTDLVFQNVTQVVELPANMPAGVSPHPSGDGIVLGVHTPFVDKLTSAQFRGLLNHEAMHILRADMVEMPKYKAPRDWFNGWAGPHLYNVAADLIINDTLMSLGMQLPEGGWNGPDRLGRDVQHEAVEALMREVAEKYPPQEQDAGGAGLAKDLADALMEAIAKAADKTGKSEQIERQAGKNKSDKSATFMPSEEQARFDRFMAETLNTAKFTESWRDIPRRMGGASEFANREIVLPRRSPLPRKKALIAIDVSGSMDERGVTRLCNLVRNAGATCELEVILFNTDVCEWKDFRTNTTMPMRGGGTSFDVVEEYCARLMRYPDAVLVLTDGEASKPSPKMPNKWTFVIYGHGVDQVRSEFGMRTVDLEAVIKR